MKKNRLILLLSVASIISFANSSLADTKLKNETIDKVVFSDQLGPENSIIQKMFGTFLSKNSGVSYSDSVVNLDNSGVGAIIVKFSGPDVCDKDSDNCVTSILRYENNSWVSIFQHKLTNLSIIQQSTDKNIVNPIELNTKDVNDKQIWYWDGRGSYFPYLETLGSVFIDNDPVSDQVLTSKVKEDIGSIYAPTADLTEKNIQVSDNVKMIMVKVGGAGNCGIDAGCQQLGYINVGGKYNMVLSDWGSGKNVILKTSHNGYQDIAIGNSFGYDEYIWNNKKYILGYTSYISKETPEP